VVNILVLKFHIHKMTCMVEYVLRSIHIASQTKAGTIYSKN